VYFGKRLLALYNHGLPYKVEPLSLTCLDPVNIGQQVPDNAMFNACPKIDPTTGRLICYSLSSDRKQIQIYEFDSKYISHSTREERVGRLFTDDFAFTKNFYIFFEPAVNFDAASYGFNRKPLAACCNMDSSKPTVVHLVPRNPTVKKQEFQMDATFLISVANAYEDEDGSIILDAVAIFNVDNISTGPICRIDVGFLPKGFSGSFAPLSFSLEEIDRAIKLNDAFGSKSWNEVESSFSGLGFRGDF